MHQHRATLIQDIQEYLGIILPYLRPLLEQYAYTGIDEESAVKWIICEELEITHCLFASGHISNQEPYLRIRDALRGLIPYDLSVITSCYIKVPRLYEENEIEVTIQERDLYIKYYAEPPPFVQYIPVL